ncbi:MAG: ATP-binding cassette domain-containing protein [Chloroflexi bacterium]|nr:ATP-binding cassette domain-containing protein [Chloroflexota bacterium]
MKPIVEARELVKQYPGTPEPAVRGVSFTIRQGEIFGLLGPNGAGKTTTISMLSCLLEPTSGSASVAGFDLLRQPAEVKKRIGLVPQDIALYPTLSARDNLAFFGRMYGLRGTDLRRRVDRALEIVGLSDRANDAIEEFSGGMKRRANLAAGLLHKPEVLFLDEPTVGVDPQSRNFIFENVRALNREGVTILYTTHYMEEAERLCDRVAIIDEGRIIALDTPQGLIDSLGGSIIYLGLPAQPDGSFVEQIQGLPEVKRALYKDDRFEITVRRIQQALVEVIAVFNRADMPITSLKIMEPNLETVFLLLTGKQLRD